MTMGDEEQLVPARAITPEMAVDSVNEVLANKRKRIPEVTADTVLEDLDFDSLDAAELFAVLEERCGLELDPESAGELETVGDLTRLREAG